MAPYTLKPLTFDDTSLWADPFRYACFQRDTHLISGPIFDPVTAEIADSWPKLVRVQPGAKSLALHVFLNDVDQDGVEAVHKLFDADKGECLLVASDSTGRKLRLSVQPVQVILEEEEHRYAFTINLYVPKPIWLADEEDEDPSATGESTFPITWSIENEGTVKAPPIFEITPSASRDHAKGFKYRWFINIANRVPRRLQSTDGLPYPIDLADGGLDLQAEIDAGRMLSSFDDLRVFIDGKSMGEHKGADRWLASQAESYESGQDSDYLSYYASTDWYMAQEFVPPAGMVEIKEVKFYLKKQGSPVGNLVAKICVDDSGDPGAVVTNGTSQNVDVSGLGTSYGWVTFTFSTPPSVTPGSTYHLKLDPSGLSTHDVSNRYAWGYDTTGAYTGGDGEHSLNDSVWNDLSGDDFLFQVLGAYRLWTNVAWEAGRSATVDGALSAGRSDGDDIEVDNPGGTAGWPDHGFGLFEEDGYEETFYYTSKTATKLQNCTWGCCGTSKVAHADGTTIWVQEHVIMVETDFTGAGDPPSPDDTKPMPSLTLSNNDKHVYSDGFLEEGSNRSGQWVRTDKEENELSSHISQEDTGALTKFVDTAANAARGRYGSLELYVPCLVAASADALEHDLAGSNAEHLLTRLYGYDYLRGHEALLASYYESDMAAGLTVTPDEKLVRLRWNTVHAAILGLAENQTLYSAIDANDIWVAEFVFDEVTKVFGWGVYCEKSSSPDGTLKVGFRSIGATDEDWPLLTPESTVANADIPSSYAWVIRSYTTPYVLQAGTYGLSVRRASATTGIVHWGMTTGRQSARGDRWVEQSGGSPWNWINGPESSLLFFILTDGSAVQDDAPYDTGGYVTLDNQGITFDTPPYIHIPAQQEIYSWDLVLGNTTTEQSGIISFVSALNKKLTINCETGEITTEDLPIAVPWAVAWEDEAARLHLASGSNNLSLSDRSGETSGVGTLTIITKHRGAWN